MNKDDCRVNPSSVEDLFPWNQQPEDRTRPLCCKDPENKPFLRKDPIEAIAYLGKIIQKYLSDPTNIQRESLRESLESHPITVSGVGFYDTSAQGDRPCIYIKYAGMKSQQDFAFHNSTGYNYPHAIERFYSRWIMGFSVYAISNQYTESLALAEEVRRFLHYFQLPIKQKLCWDQLQVIEEQAPAYDENFSCYTTVISCTATFGDTWLVQEMAPLIKKVALDISVL